MVGFTDLAYLLHNAYILRRNFSSIYCILFRRSLYIFSRPGELLGPILIESFSRGLAKGIRNRILGIHDHVGDAVEIGVQLLRQV